MMAWLCILTKRCQSLLFVIEAMAHIVARPPSIRCYNFQFYIKENYGIVGISCGKIFTDQTILLSEKNLQFLNIVSTTRYIERCVWIQNCVLALIFANAFHITKFEKLRLAINSHYMVSTCNLIYTYVTV